MTGLLHDLRFAARSLRRQPGLTLAVVVCLALGMGANSTAYSGLRALVLHPMPAADHRGLVVLAEANAGTDADYDLMAAATWRDVVAQSRTVGDVAAGRWWDVNLTGGDAPERVTGYQVTPNLFTLLGARPLLGRVYVDDGLGRETPGVVLGEALWRRRFGADPRIVGRVVTLDGDPHVVTGVLAAAFIFPAGAELWAPLRLTPAEAAERDPRALRVVGRLRPGATLDAARAELATIAGRIAAGHPATNAGWTLRVEDANAFLAIQRRPYLLAMQLSSALVLLIACVNVASLLLARATAREREIGVRVALGAGRWRLARQLLVESLLLALLGAAASVFVALWGVLALRQSLPAELVRFNPGWLNLAVDGSVLAYTALVALGTGLLFGMAPVAQALRAAPGAVLRDGRGAGGGARRHRARGALVVAQLAMAMVLLVATGLTLRTFVHLARANPGFDAGPLLTMQLSLPARDYDEAATVRFYERLVPAIGALPGVAAAGVVNALPLDWEDYRTTVRLEERPRTDDEVLPQVRSRVIDAHFLDALGVPVLRGRGITAADREGSLPVALVSETAAARLWPDGEAVGRRYRQGRDTTLRTVVGVVRDVRQNPNLERGALAPTVYMPLAQRQWRDMALLVRAAPGHAPAALAGEVQRAIAGLDPGLAAGEVALMTRVAYAALSPQRATAGMLAALGLIALVLATVGVYGVIAYATAQRTHELGVRVALGATRGDVVRLVLRRGLWLTALGIGVGIVGALVVTRLLAAILQGVRPTDPLTFAGTALLLAAVSLAAAYLPARRAARVAPSVALRAE